MQHEVSPLTGILEEDKVFIEEGKHYGKSVLEISDVDPEFYDFLIGRKQTGDFSIKRHKDKSYRLYWMTH